MAATVLVADDDADILRLIELNFRLEGFEVVTARDGLDALAKAIAVRPDLVVLDVLMPGIDGYHLRADPCQCQPGRGPGAHRDGQLRPGGPCGGSQRWGDDFLAKPFHPTMLLDKAKAMLSETR